VIARLEGIGWRHFWWAEARQSGGHPDLLPHHVPVITPPPDLDRHAYRTEDMHTVFVGGNHVDLGGLVELGNIVHAVGLRASLPQV
jgi:hypothetical protein